MTRIATTQDGTHAETTARPLAFSLLLNWEKRIYLLFIFIALVSRFWGLGERVMSHDESLHTQYSYQYYIGDGYQHTPLMHGPSLFHTTAFFYWLFGANDFTSRLPVAILGVILVIAPYFLRNWIGRIGALFASFIFLISPFITYYSRYIRHDIYIICAAFLTFAAAWHYLRARQEKYLWTFAAGVALMFITMETSYIYTAIFGSFIVLRLLNEIRLAPWLGQALPRLRQPLLIALLGALLFGGAFIGARLIPGMLAESAAETPTPTSEGFAADPNEATQPATPAVAASGSVRAMQWLQVAGLVVFSAGLFLTARALRPRLDDLPEWDLVLILTTLVLPAAAAIPIRLAGFDPRDYTLSNCQLPSEGTMSAVSVAIGKLFNADCWSLFLSSGVVRSGLFLMIMLVVSVLLGLWWDRRRWPVVAVIYHAIFIVFYTSVFTNLSGWASGNLASLGYWLDQHPVQRGSQPTFYYFFLVPFYEFLPVLFSFIATWFWLAKQRLNKIAGYWLSGLLGAVLLTTLINWLVGVTGAAEAAVSKTPGLVAAGVLLVVLALYWFLVRQRQIKAEYGLRHNWKGLLDSRELFGFVPSLVWWLLLTWTIYSVAGEKMPWLTTHWLTPMALLVGWYFNEKLDGAEGRALLARRPALLIGLAAVIIVAVLLAVGPLFLGQISLTAQQQSNLNYLGRFLGSLLVVGLLIYLWRRHSVDLERPVRQRIWLLATFIFLSALTIRFAYLSSFPNADYTTEFMVYAHGAPATKDTVMSQIESLSMRMHGDKSIRVAYDDDSSWPFTWYLRDYPNRQYFGKNPGRNITDAPVIVAGSANWTKVEPFLSNDYETRTYTFLWWPMEEYRKISWGAIFGNPRVAAEERRGLLDANARQALWDIFFYRDYRQYGEVFGGTYAAGQWPLRHDLRLYIRRDALANLWDYGANAATIAPPVDPYEAGELLLSPQLVVGSSGAGQGQLQAPRNVAIGPDGNLYVADSGNHRIQVFDAQGQYVRGWGSFGDQIGQFNEPWGIAVDDQFVYVADTWNHRIQKFTLDGQQVGTFGQGGTPAEGQEGGALFFGPRDVAVLPDNRLLVTDTGNHRLQLLDATTGNFVRAIGQQGAELGQFYEPVGLAIGPDGAIYLADTWNGRIQTFSPDLQPTGEWMVDAWAGESINNKPYLAVDSQGRVYVTDPEGFRVLIFSSDGEYLGRFGNYAPDTTGFGLPNGIAIDAQDNVYIADSGNHVVLKFAPPLPAAPATGDDAEQEEPAQDSDHSEAYPAP